jgi:1-acyl-sn-glycerol-3-phosphate acyltransferase
VELEEAIGKIEGIREGNVAAFGSKSSDSGTERLVILAETRKKDTAARQQIKDAVTAIVTDLTGTPPDEVVLAPPNTVLKTSSGKIRRSASREIYEHELIGKPQQAVWVQLTRFTVKGLLPRVRSSIQRLQAILYATWCWTVYCLLAPVVGILVFTIPQEKPRWAIMRFGVKTLAFLTGTGIHIHGRENLPKAADACIFVSNHASYLDGYALTAALDRNFSFVAKAELKTKSIIHILLKRIGTLFVERFDQKGSIKDAKKLTEIGMTNRSLFFFPEGTFMRMPGLLPFRMGAFETAARTGLPIVPIAIRGTRSILRADSWFPRHGSVTVTFGTPVSMETPAADDQDVWNTALQLRDRTREWLLTHCGEPDLGHERPRLQPSGPVLHN